MAKKCEEMGYIYECYDCGRRFVSKVNVSRHMPHCVGVKGINPNRRGKERNFPTTSIYFCFYNIMLLFFHMPN